MKDEKEPHSLVISSVNVFPPETKKYFLNFTFQLVELEKDFAEV